VRPPTPPSMGRCSVRPVGLDVPGASDGATVLVLVGLRASGRSLEGRNAEKCARVVRQGSVCERPPARTTKMSCARIARLIVCLRPAWVR